MLHNDRISHVNLRLWMVILVFGQVLLLAAAVYEGTLQVAGHTAHSHVRVYLVFLPPVVESGPVTVVELIIVLQISILQLLCLTICTHTYETRLVDIDQLMQHYYSTWLYSLLFATESEFVTLVIVTIPFIFFFLSRTSYFFCLTLN